MFNLHIRDRIRSMFQQVAKTAGVTPYDIFHYIGGKSFDYLNREISKFEHSALSGIDNGGIKINIGPGKFFHPQWKNLDADSNHYASRRRGPYLTYDLMAIEKLPFDDDSVAIAYTSHVIEHVPDEAVENLFKEVFRVLCPRGVFRITCPNADLYYGCVVRNDSSAVLPRGKKWFLEKGIPESDEVPLDYLVKAVATPRNPLCLKHNSTFDLALTYEDVLAQYQDMSKLDFLDWLISPLHFDIERIGSHINWWNFEKLSRKLNTAGFNDVAASSCGSSVANELRDMNYFDNTHPSESIYVETIKARTYHI